MSSFSIEEIHSESEKKVSTSNSRTSYKKHFKIFTLSFHNIKNFIWNRNIQESCYVQKQWFTRILTLYFLWHFFIFLKQIDQTFDNLL
jgi:hypothetical protein